MVQPASEWKRELLYVKRNGRGNIIAIEEKQPEGYKKPTDNRVTNENGSIKRSSVAID